MEEKNVITYYEITKINDMFTQQNWPIDEKNKSSLYNRFLKTYKQLEAPERELFIKLSRRYKWVLLSEYQEMTITLMEKVVKNYLSNKQDILVYPIKKAEHMNTIKSSDAIAYLCKSIQMQHSDVLYKKKFRVLGSLTAVEEKCNVSNGKPLLLFDDYIGSGKYALEVIDELKSIGIKERQIIICSLFISEDGLRRISSRDCHVEYIKVAQNIINKLTSTEKSLLTQIENKIVDNEKFRFGFGGAGSLISLIRTPNNSLPIFWLDKGRSHLAPFPR